jgi:DNA-binding NtrC family response regulator
MRARASGGEQGGWLVILCPEKERARTADPRVQILLDYRSRSQPILPDHGPVVVIEPNRDLRRLLVSQIERIGALCYPADDLESALKLLSAEPRAQTVLLDFALAGDRLSQWLSAIREIRPAALLIGTGGAGSAGEVAAPGLTRRLPKPWRIVDLLDAMTR